MIQQRFAMRLRFSAGPRAGTVVDLGDDKVTIGRAPENVIVLRDQKVSRQHAVIERDLRGELVLRDLGSANGTWIDGEAANDPVPLRGGEHIRIGRSEAAAEVHAAVPAVPGERVLGREAERVRDWVERAGGVVEATPRYLVGALSAAGLDVSLSEVDEALSAAGVVPEAPLRRLDSDDPVVLRVEPRGKSGAAEIATQPAPPSEADRKERPAPGLSDNPRAHFWSALGLFITVFFVAYLWQAILSGSRPVLVVVLTVVATLALPLVLVSQVNLWTARLQGRTPGAGIEPSRVLETGFRLLDLYLEKLEAVPELAMHVLGWWSHRLTRGTLRDTRQRLVAAIEPLLEPREKLVAVAPGTMSAHGIRRAYKLVGRSVAVSVTDRRLLVHRTKRRRPSDLAFEAPRQQASVAEWFKGLGREQWQYVLVIRLPGERPVRVSFQAAWLESAWQIHDALAGREDEDSAAQIAEKPGKRFAAIAVTAIVTAVAGVLGVTASISDEGRTVPAGPPAAPVTSPSGTDSDGDGLPDDVDPCPSLPTNIGCR